MRTERGRTVAAVVGASDSVTREAITDLPASIPAKRLRARTVLVRRMPSMSTQRARLLEPWPIAKPPSAEDQHCLKQRAAGLEALYASASAAQTAEFSARVPNLPALAAMAPAKQDCAVQLYAVERQALWSGARRDSLVPAYGEASRPLRPGIGNGREQALEVRLRESLMQALASLMTPGQRMAALADACSKPWPGLGDAKAHASRDLLRRTFWSLFDLMTPQELAQAVNKLADLKKSAPTDAAHADRILLLEHALAGSQAWRATRPGSARSSDRLRAQLVHDHLSQPGSRAGDFDSACDPASLLALKPEALELALRPRAVKLQVLTTLMTPERRLLSLVHASRQYAEAATQRTPTRQPSEHLARQRLMQERLHAIFSAMTPDEIAHAKTYLASLAGDNAAAPTSPSSPNLRAQKAHGSFLKLCDEALKAITRPVRER